MNAHTQNYQFNIIIFHMSAALSLKDLLLWGELSIKNAHTATQLVVHDNRLVLLAIEEQINIYSLYKMACNQAALIKVIQLTPLYILLTQFWSNR